RTGENDAERQAQPARDGGDMIHAIERRQGWKEPEDRAKASRLELPTLDEVHRPRGGGSRKRRDTHEAQRNVREQPDTFHAGGLTTRCEAYNVREGRRQSSERRGDE